MRRNKKQKTEFISSVQNLTKDQLSIREKKEAIDFLKQNGFSLGKNINYSKRQDNKMVFWINPKTYALEKDWDLILNNQFENEIILLHIPANSLSMKTSTYTGLVSRHDKPDRIDLSISADNFIDQRSKCDFSKFIIKRMKY